MNLYRTLFSSSSSFILHPTEGNRKEQNAKNDIKEASAAQLVSFLTGRAKFGDICHVTLQARDMKANHRKRTGK